MAVVPPLPQVVSGVWTSSQLSQLEALIAFLAAPPIARLRQTTPQTLTTGVLTAVTFTTEDDDSVNGHDNSTNPSRYTAVYPGRYLLLGQVGFMSNATGVRICVWRVNGTSINGTQVQTVPATGQDTAMAACGTEWYLNVGDYVELWAFQSSGGNLNTASGPEDVCSMTVKWVSN